jgi:hypothetical protein
MSMVTVSGVPVTLPTALTTIIREFDADPGAPLAVDTTEAIDEAWVPLSLMATSAPPDAVTGELDADAPADGDVAADAGTEHPLSSSAPAATKASAAATAAAGRDRGPGRGSRIDGS